MTRESNIRDQAEREQAIDPKKSFIVQAPAGSGKTELLIQRFLALLGTVQENPEEILAITFTRKAAAEMRRRIFLALQNAQENTEPPTSAHAYKTWQLAKLALARNHSQQWDLLENPQRLCVTTIDSFCSRLNNQLPLLSQINAEQETRMTSIFDAGNTSEGLREISFFEQKITENPEQHYQQAARNFLASLEEDTTWRAALAELLLHLDNNYRQAENLFTSMLANRDQWLPYLVSNKNLQSLRKQLEKSLKQAIHTAEKKCQEIIPQHLFQEITILLEFSKQNLNASQTSENTIIRDKQDTEVTSPSLWQDIAQLLLTQKNEFRKSYDKRTGFPAHAKEMKERMQNLLSSLQKNSPDEGQLLRQSLQDVLELPPPTYTEQQWSLIVGLLQLLPLLVGHLLLIFRERREVDFVELVAGANRALGECDNPSNLALQLDYRIQHILVDEFQDTSISHYRVLEKLVGGWQPGDGRSLFLVGDPMQSIYRFRQAEVGLFLRARLHGVGDVPLIPLTLRVNFRSTPAILNWLNHTFKQVLPARDTISHSAVSYAPAHAPHANPKPDDVEAINAVELHAITSPENTATGHRIADIITQTWQRNPKASIAILVKSRSHLHAILPVLKQAGLHYQAVDIEPLSQSPIIQDLFALTRALIHLADRTAWLAILRAPWCGLKLADLHLLANYSSDPLTPLWASLEQCQQLALSDDAKQRLERVVSVLNAAINERQRKPLAEWIKGTWQALGGPACAENDIALESSTAYFTLLQKCNQTSNAVDLSVLKNKLEGLYANVNPLADARLQIMTIHKAKGLEFDTVILPGLERKAPIDKNKLLIWMESPQDIGENQLILAPITSENREKTDSIYRYLRQQDNKKNYYETGRLLYVAATRAKQSLHLLITSPNKNSEENTNETEKSEEESKQTFESTSNQIRSLRNPAPGSLLEQLWPALKNDFMRNIEESLATTINHPPITENRDPTDFKLAQTTRRLVADWKLPNPHHSNCS